MSKDLRNPFASNFELNLEKQYVDCLKSIELSTPIRLIPFFKMLLDIGNKTMLSILENGKRIDCIYVVYILSAGLIDDY